MTFAQEIFSGKRWLFTGSLLGGFVGALLIHLNELLPNQSQFTLGLNIGLILATALGMIGGIIGGVIGSFLSGFFAGEDIYLNIGVSLGIGMINGFISGTIAGFGMGCIHKWLPHLATANTILMAIGVILIAAVIFLLMKRRKS